MNILLMYWVRISELEMNCVFTYSFNFYERETLRICIESSYRVMPLKNTYVIIVS